MLTLVMLLVVSQDLEVCAKDSDCLISTTQCCAGCCGSGPYATTKKAEAQKQQRCAVMECAQPEPCTIVCEPPASPDGFVAKCVKKACAMKQKK
jgi:hypothetical protein